MPLPIEVLAALEASSKHWEENLAAERPSDASVWGDHCALCQLFNAPDKDPNLEDCMHEFYGECPVFAATGEPYCGGSPWYHARRAHSRWSIGSIYREDWQRSAQAELDFLRSLLPKASE